ncbi:hypothetical protein [Paenarthrobacter sp. PH39-S1]|uniref:hypothetical protein n=1 Tax=Paenarthrobacter sp. PH39-S1 TaxID=3046204 RepID=UPI0024BA104B|nr:hypothetical protein [Paenarthrobacter sp. PH39-S1]MDJ0358086.1 hypothetical protein [Paenarthrobacter sp. PH39-S1]
MTVTLGEFGDLQAEIVDVDTGQVIYRLRYKSMSASANGKGYENPRYEFVGIKG